MNRAAWMLSGLALLVCGLGQARADMFAYTGNLQTYTVLTSGTYDITAAGGQGGSGGSPSAPPTGGLGAIISGDFSLNAGETLQIVVGGQGGSGNFGDVFGGGGGGGSFVYISATQPLLVAGGGGGGSDYFSGSDPNKNGGNGQTVTAGQDGFGTLGGMGGTNGDGGGGGGGDSGGGGGTGWISNGSNGPGLAAGDGGSGSPTFLGGIGSNEREGTALVNNNGGFGGGGGGGIDGGGGGGGDSGGGGGEGVDSSAGVDGVGGGGGGGSYIDPSPGGFFGPFDGNSGNGYVLIVPAGPNTATPEPSSLVLLGLGGAGFAVFGWRRRRPNPSKPES